MNIKKNFLLFLCIWQVLFTSSLQADGTIFEIAGYLIRSTTAMAVNHLTENGSKYIGAIVITTIGATINNALNKRPIDNKQLEELKAILILKNKKDKLTFESFQNQLDTIQQMQETQMQQLNFYQKHEAVYQAQIDFYECLLNTNKDHKACASKKKAFEQANDKLLNDILNHSNIKEAL